MSKRTILTTLAGVALTGGLAVTGAGPASAANYVAGPYGSLSSCNSSRMTYVHDGGFSYVGSCYRQSNGYYYFQYR